MQVGTLRLGILYWQKGGKAIKYRKPWHVEGGYIHLATRKNWLNFNSYLNEFSDFVTITSNKDKFANELKTQIENPRSETVMKDFAKRFDWKILSIQFYDYIRKIT